MATLSAQITDLVGGTIDQDACDQWAVDGVKEIILQLPEAMQVQASDKTTVTSDSALSFNTATVGKVLYCTRHNGSYERPCRLVEGVNAGLLDDSTASNYYATADDPAYFLRDNEAKIKPNPDGNGGSFYHIVYPSSINVDVDSTIANFPNEADYLVVLYVATRQLLQYMSSSAISTFSLSATAPSAPTIGTVDYSPASNADAANADAANADASVTDVTATGSLASAPSIIDVSSNAPGYTPPTVAGATEELTATITSGTVGTDADWQDYSDWFEVLGQMIEGNEDIEMASVQLNKISTYLQSYGLAMQNQLNEFNEGNVRYQMEFQEAVTKANQDLQVAIANANNGAAELRQEAQQATEMSKFNKQQDQTLDQFNKQQDQALDQFNKAQDQALNLANAAKQMEDVMHNNSSILQKHTAEIQNFSAKVTAEVQTYTQEITEKGTEYTWYGDQYAKLSAEYTKGLTALKGT